MATHAAPEVRRAQILEAALRCFGEQGYHAARVDDIARASGLSKGAIYWHFDSKDEIFLALFDAFDAELFREWDALDDAEPLAALRRAGEIAIARLLGPRELLDTWTEFLRHPEARSRLAGVYRRSRALLARIVRRGVDVGTLRPCDPEHVAAMLVGAIEGVLLQALCDRDYDASAVWPTVWETIERGLRAARSSDASD